MESLYSRPGRRRRCNPRDINDAGQIVGSGTNPQGIRRAFLLNPLPPIPAASAWTLLGCALALLAAGTILLRRGGRPQSC
jgi:hypothetical protein